MAGAMRSAWCGDLTCCSTFSRCSDSISGPLVSTTSTVLRLARASATARCSTFSELARQTLTLTPYFFSKAPTSAPMSSDCAEVYRLSSASFLAPSISFFRRSGPAYKPTSATVAFGLTCPGTEAGRTAPATNRLARRLNPSGFMSRVLFRSMAEKSVGFLPYPLTFEEEIRPKFLPVVGLVERDHRVDHLEGELVEVCFHGAARGHPVALLQDRLAFEGEHEVGKEQRRVGVRGAARHADRVRATERRFERLPPDRGAFYDQALGVMVVDRGGEWNLARGDELGHQRVPAAYFGFRGGELPGECEALLLAHRLDHGAEPVGVAAFDPDSAREARVKQVLVGIGHLVRPDEIGVVGDGEEI